MEITYLYGNVLVIPSELIGMVGMFKKWKYSHERKSYLIRLTINTRLFVFKKHYFNLSSRIKLFLFPLLTSPNNKFVSEMAYNTTATLDKLARTDYVDFGKCQERSGRFLWTENDSNYLDNKLKVFERRQ